MYAPHFGLRAEAFSLTPDPAFLYLSPDHAEALAGLKIGLESRRGLMLMIAEVGMGKTTLLYTMLDQLDPQVHTAYLSNTRLSFDDLLRQALADLGAPCASRDRVELLNALNTFLHHCAAAGETAALIVDEAQNLDEETFENLRLLSNFETYTDKLLQIVLVGQPELDAKLSRPSLRQVTERVAVRCHINPFTHAESVRYLEHRLRIVGGSTALFTPTALRLITWQARGIPRRLNILCHSALLFAFGRGAKRVSLREARSAIREKQGRGLVSFSPRVPRFVFENAPANDLNPWRIGAAGIAGAMFALGWGSHYLGGSSVDVPVAASSSIIRPSDATAAPTSDKVPVDAPVAESAPAAPVVAPEEVAAEPSALAPEPEPEIHAALPPTATVLTADVASAPEPQADAAPPDEPTEPSFREIVVPRGTSLVTLAQQYYGSGGPKLIERIRALNPQIVNVDQIFAGDRLRLPELDETDRHHE